VSESLGISFLQSRVGALSRSALPPMPRRPRRERLIWRSGGPSVRQRPHLSALHPPASAPTSRGVAEGRRNEDGLTMHGSRITWAIGGAVVALIVVAGVDALRSPDDGAATSATAGVTTTPFFPTTTVVTVIDDQDIDDQDQGTPSVLNQAPEEEVDEAGNPLPACSPEQLTVGIPPPSDREGQGFSGLVTVRPIVDGCRQDYPYFRVAFRDIRGKQLLVWSGRLFYDPDSTAGQTFSVHFQPIPCRRWEVVPALVTVGYNPTPGGKAFRAEARCE
jgi:hypothetical protein